jgi:hypothetical protein
VGARGGSGRAGGFQSLRWRKIFSMIAGSSMKLMIRNRPPHLGHASGGEVESGERYSSQSACSGVKYSLDLVCRIHFNTGSILTHSDSCLQSS